MAKRLRLWEIQQGGDVRQKRLRALEARAYDLLE